MRRWHFPDIGELSADIVRLDQLEDIDATWPAIRERMDPDGTDPARGWLWCTIGGACSEKHAVRDGDGAIVALWASAKEKPIKLQEGPAYRLDWLEVRADLRSGGRGLACLAIIAARAIELGADRVVLGAHPDPRTLRFYDTIGAERRAPRPWKAPRNLVAYVLGPKRTSELKGWADDLEA